MLYHLDLDALLQVRLVA
jgi:hypothetical protein